MNLLKEQNGKTSLMRIISAASCVVGLFMCIYGTLTHDATAMTIGGGLAAASTAAKAVQKKYEPGNGPGGL